MHNKISNNCINIHGLFQILARTQFFQCGYQAVFICLCDICFGIIKDIRIAVNVVIYILQQNIITAVLHSASAAAAAVVSALHTVGRRLLGIIFCVSVAIGRRHIIRHLTA